MLSTLTISTASAEGITCTSALRDAVIGRSGPWIRAVFANGKWLRVNQDDGVVKSLGRDTTYSMPEISYWAAASGRAAYSDWRFMSTIPLRAMFEYFRQSKWRESDFFNGHPLLEPVIYRKLFLPYLKTVVRQNGRIHIRLSQEDETFLRQLNGLPPSERFNEVNARIKSILKTKIGKGVKSPVPSDGTLTRLELLSVCKDPHLFNASTFYHFESMSWVAFSNEEKVNFFLGYAVE